MKKIIQTLAVCLFASLMIQAGGSPDPGTSVRTNEVTKGNSIVAVTSETVTVEASVYASTPVEKYAEVKTLVEEEYPLSKEEIELLALVAMAEAEGESDEGKRLVIDTVLNRVDSNKFPDTVSEVIYQPGQFSSMWNGRVDRCYVDEDIYKLVKEELQSRINDEVVYFHAGKYSKYGTPLLQVENHYFSSI